MALNKKAPPKRIPPRDPIATPFTLAAIDSGKDGAIAILKVHSRTNVEILAIHDMPHNSEHQIPHVQTNIIAEYLSSCDYVALESVYGIQGKGTSHTMFVQGGNYHPIGYAVDCAGLSDRLTLMSAQLWKKTLGVQGGTETSKKKKTFDLCCSLFPDQLSLFSGPRGGMKDGRTDALGIGLAWIKRNVG